MNLGIGILYITPPPKETDLFSFLQPFTLDVWLYTGLAYISISVFVFILSRINQDDWDSSHPCKVFMSGSKQEHEREIESIWNFMNCE
jgi:glutamate receptor, ionotropic, invertebrate